MSIAPDQEGKLIHLEKCGWGCVACSCMAVHLALLKGQGLGTGLYELVSPALTAAGGCR